MKNKDGTTTYVVVLKMRLNERPDFENFDWVDIHELGTLAPEEGVYLESVHEIPDLIDTPLRAKNDPNASWNHPK